jgi:hypothetical protein
MMKVVNALMLILNTLLLFGWLLMLILLEGQIGVINPPAQFAMFFDLHPVLLNIILLSYFSLMEIVLAVNFLRK